MQAVNALTEFAHVHDEFLVAIEQRFTTEIAEKRARIESSSAANVVKRKLLRELRGSEYKTVYGTNLWNFVAIKIIAVIMKVDIETYKKWVGPIRYTLPVGYTFIMSDACLHCGSGTPGSRLHAYCNTNVSPISAAATTHDITLPGWSSALSCLFKHLFHQ